MADGRAPNGRRREGGSFIFPALSPIVPVVAVGVERRSVVGMLQLRSGGLPITMQGGDGRRPPWLRHACLRGVPRASRGDEERAARTGPDRRQLLSLHGLLMRKDDLTLPPVYPNAVPSQSIWRYRWMTAVGSDPINGYDLVPPQPAGQ